jgi:hypothetical protein
MLRPIPGSGNAGIVIAGTRRIAPKRKEACESPCVAFFRQLQQRLRLQMIQNSH